MRDLTNYRGIPPPLPDYMCRVEHIPPLRRSKATDYVKTDQRFLIELLFNSDIDLALFERFILNSPVRIAEYAVGRETSRVFMIDPRIPTSATSDDVWKWTREELPQIQAAIAVECPHYQPASVRCLIDLSPGEGIALINPPLQMMVHGADSAPAINQILQAGVDFLNPYIQKCAADGDFKEAMKYCGQALGLEGANQWASLYRAYEVIADRFGGHHGIVTKLVGCSKPELDRFRTTVNHQEAIGGFSRHARQKTQPPPDPMPFDVATRFVLSLMRSWFRSGE